MVYYVGICLKMVIIILFYLSGIYSQGPWADLLTGVVEQNFIFHVFDHALCLTDTKKCTKPVARGGKGVPSKACNKYLTNIVTIFVVMAIGKLVLL